MLRDPNLHPLSEHHHHVLVLCLEIRKAAESAAGPERDARSRETKLRKLAESLLRFWTETGRQHFEEEEQVVLPVLAKHVSLSDDPDVGRMLADHAEIRGKMQELKDSLAGSFKPNLCIELGRTLHDHVRLEEERVFPKIESALAESELASIGSRLTRLHGKR